jgi:hypothetical protein
MRREDEYRRLSDSTRRRGYEEQNALMRAQWEILSATYVQLADQSKKTMTPAHITSGSRQNGIEETLRSKIKGQAMVTSLAHQPRRGRRDTRSGNNFAVWGRAACLSLPEPHHSLDGGAKLARGTQSYRWSIELLSACKMSSGICLPTRRPWRLSPAKLFTSYLTISAAGSDAFTAKQAKGRRMKPVLSATYWMACTSVLFKSLHLTHQPGGRVT